MWAVCGGSNWTYWAWRQAASQHAELRHLLYPLYCQHHTAPVLLMCMTWLYRSTSISFSTTTLPCWDTCGRPRARAGEGGSARGQKGGAEGHRGGLGGRQARAIRETVSSPAVSTQLSAPSCQHPTNKRAHQEHPPTHLAHIIAPQVHKHDVLSTLLLIRQQLRLQGSVLLRGQPPLPRPRQRPAAGAGTRGGGGRRGEVSRSGGHGRWSLQTLQLMMSLGCPSWLSQQRQPAQPSPAQPSPGQASPGQARPGQASPGQASKTRLSMYTVFDTAVTHLLVTRPSSPTRHRISGLLATMMQPRACR